MASDACQDLTMDGDRCGCRFCFLGRLKKRYGEGEGDLAGNVNFV